MSSTITVPAGFSYVLAALLSTSFVLRWQSDYMVSKARKAAGIPYPQMYAEKAEHAASKAAQVFNCTQRAHQNTLEGLPAILVTTLISAIYSPLVAASACGFWSFARILYTLGYSTGEPKRVRPSTYEFIASAYFPHSVK
ncbi:membrane-associated proteins in eicosanoid and glutathione metabolism [Auriscalpium vulgare]|uniref:Membrane-associated proteins in eicosanoid and glutathione metabolism n=1 Tax=Auriscalpium vulgare TaxID=40419 RepID=A0ACB8SB05_9AGAM|nr:membrane-associated proteins in eicosanoid and glutathione metabolism [Auriscalpium vulgare]